MSHLGDLLSAHVDGELDGAERDRVSAHLARCERCRADAAGLRALKRQIGELASHVPGERDMTQRLVEIAEIAAAVGADPSAGRVGKIGRVGRVGKAGTVGKAGQVGRVGKLGRPALIRHRVLSRPSRALTGPGVPFTSRRPRLARRRYVVLGAMSIVVSLGTAAFSMGGGDAAPPGPKIVPQVEMYSEEHAITTGEVPFEGPGPTMGPVLSTAGTSTASSAARQP